MPALATPRSRSALCVLLQENCRFWAETPLCALPQKARAASGAEDPPLRTTTSDTSWHASARHCVSAAVCVAFSAWRRLAAAADVQHVPPSALTAEASS